MRRGPASGQAHARSMVAISLHAWAAMLVAASALIPTNALVLAFVLADVWDRNQDKMAETWNEQQR